MTSETHHVGDVRCSVVTTSKCKQYISISQGDDVIILYVDQAREIAAIIDEV